MASGSVYRNVQEMVTPAISLRSLYSILNYSGCLCVTSLGFSILINFSVKNLIRNKAPVSFFSSSNLKENAKESEEWSYKSVCRNL